MSGDATITGMIRFDPPVAWAELRGRQRSPGLPGECPDTVLHVDVETVDTADGVLERRTAAGIVPRGWETNGYTLVDDVDRIAQAFVTTPDGTPRSFSGFLHMSWGHGEYVCRVVVRDGRAVKVEPEVIWPDGASDGAL